MEARLVALGLVLALGLGGSLQARPLGAGGQEVLRGPDDEPEAAPDTVFTARMQPVEIVAERIVANSSGETRVASAASSQHAGTAGRSGRTAAQPTEVDARSRASDQQAARREGQAEGRRSERGVGIGGFVMNETFSVVGNDFYAAFYSAWSEPEEASLYTVYVREEPAPQFGARLAVEVDDSRVYQTFLRPNNRKVREAAQDAAERAQVYVEEYHEPRDVY